MSPTFRYIPIYIPIYKYQYIYTNVFEADIYKNPPPNVIYPIVCYLFRAGTPLITLLTAGVLTDRQLPATDSNNCARLMYGWVASAGCPQKNCETHHASGDADLFIVQKAV